MKTSLTFGAAVLALAALTTTCTTVASKPAGGESVYLVGVAGGG